MRKEVRTAQLLADAEHQAAAQADPQPRPAPRRPPQQGEEVQAKPGVARAGVPGRETRLRRHAGRAQGEQSDEGLVAAIAQQIPWAFHRYQRLQQGDHSGAQRHGNNDIKQRPAQGPVTALAPMMEAQQDRHQRGCRAHPFADLVDERAGDPGVL
ncbi:hypothetical protein G6F57_018883 [Rhizopus arrhizus]|nr:hypothetical protein G6F22_019650 [Rhizopus arrhizus]KAG1440882.1 hypothetical protein G6F57_018883 [Rhizopus arrhizus]